MATNQDKLSTLQAALQFLLKDYLTVEEAASYLPALKGAIDTATEQLNQKIDSRLAQIRDGAEGKTGPQGPKGDKGDSVVGPMGPQGEKGDKGDKGDPGDIKDLSPQEIRDELELITDEDEKLKISAIGHLQEQLDELRKQVGKGGGGGGTNFVIQRGQVLLYDLSDQLDGVTKTFSLPAFWRVIDVKLYSAPALRPTVDYTTDGSAFTITFTSQIDAATYLAAGQTLLVEYASL